jgi:hypothetical protein
MKAADILKRNKPPSILIYGPAGTGKTALVSQLTNAYMFDFDEGMLTAATLEDKFFDDRHKIEFDLYRDENPKKPKEYHAAKKELFKIRQACADKKWEHDGVVVDSLTGLCLAVQLAVMSRGDKANPNGDPLAKPHMGSYGTMRNEVEGMLTIMRSLQTLLVVTAHVEIAEMNEQMKVFPSSVTKPHGLNKLTYLFDEVWFTSVSGSKVTGKKYKVTAEPTSTLIARTRTGFSTETHNYIGMVGLLEKVGYKYGQ